MNVAELVVHQLLFHRMRRFFVPTAAFDGLAHCKDWYWRLYTGVVVDSSHTQRKSVSVRRTPAESAKVLVTLTTVLPSIEPREGVIF